MNVELFTATLDGDGHTVIVERDGRAALDRALGERFDALLLDVQLPRLSGIEICEHLRAAGVRTPILALTALAMTDQIERGRAAGFNEYLVKPISPAALRKAVRRFEPA